MNENARMEYNPQSQGAEGHPPSSPIENACRTIMGQAGIQGVGKGIAADGSQMVVAYVRDQQALSQLPASIDGIRVVGHVTGEVKAY